MYGKKECSNFQYAKNKSRVSSVFFSDAAYFYWLIIADGEIHNVLLVIRNHVTFYLTKNWSVLCDSLTFAVKYDFKFIYTRVFA